MNPQRKQPPKKQYADKLAARILAGEWAPGALLPASREIAEEYGCAPNTAMEALRILAADGLIVMRPRQGSIVALTRRSVAGPVERLLYSRAGGLRRTGETSEILSARLVEACTNPDAAGIYNVPEDGQLGMREYVIRDADGTANTYGRSFFHPEVWGQVAELREPAPIEDGAIGAISRVLHRETEVVPTQRTAWRATALEARGLGVEVGSPVLAEVTVCRLVDGGVAEYAVYVHPERYWVGR